MGSHATYRVLPTVANSTQINKNDGIFLCCENTPMFSPAPGPLKKYIMGPSL